MSLSDEKYVALTTYRRNGEPKTLPVWIADLGDGTLGFTTPSNSYKVKRLARDNRVVLQPSNGRGVPREGTEEVTGTAIVVGGADYERIHDRIKAKYGIQFTLISVVASALKLIGKGSDNDAAVVVTLD